jgi:hypothetical protein
MLSFDWFSDHPQLGGFTFGKQGCIGIIEMSSILLSQTQSSGTILLW